MNPTQTLQRTEERAIQFTPFGSADAIKLSVKIIQNMVAVPTKSGKTCSDRDALRFMMLCQAQRLNPFAGDAFLVGYDTQNGPSFSLITAHQAFLKRAETCPDFEGMESGIILLADDGSTTTEREGDFHLESENVVGGWARVHRKGRKDTYRRIRMSRFNNGYAQWKADPAGMIVKCAEADALRSTFPTLLGGLYMQGEMDQAADRIVVNMSSNRTSFDPKGLVETTSVTRPPAEQRTEPAASEEDGSDLGPQKPQPLQSQPAAPTPKAELQSIVLEAGFTFDDLKRFGAETGNLSDADSLGGFEDVKESDVKRLLRSKEGLLKALAAIKAQEGSAA